METGQNNTASLDPSVFFGSHTKEDIKAIGLTLEPNFFSIWFYADPFGEQLIGHERKVHRNADLSSLAHWKSLPLLFAIETGSPFTLIPSSIYKEEDAPHYLAFNAQTNLDAEVDQDHIPQLELTVAYTRLSNLAQPISTYWPGVKVNHVASHLLQSMRRSNFEGKPHLCALFGTAPHYTICLFRSGSLLLANSLEAAYHSDILYYILFACKNLEVEEKLNFLLLGECAGDEALHEALGAYGQVTHQYFPSAFGLDLPGVNAFKGHLFIGYTGMLCA